jgi:hypothetical protein
MQHISSNVGKYLPKTVGYLCTVSCMWIVRFVKARRISWIGHVERMEDSRKPKTVMREKIYTRRKMGRPKVRWLDDVQEDLREWGLKDGEGKLRIETSGGE